MSGNSLTTASVALSEGELFTTMTSSGGGRSALTARRQVANCFGRSRVQMINDTVGPSTRASCSRLRTCFCSLVQCFLCNQDLPENKLQGIEPSVSQIHHGPEPGVPVVDAVEEQHDGHDGQGHR